MPHVYENTPDDRLSNETITPSRFRPKYRQLTAEEKLLHDELKNKAAELEMLFEKVKPGRYRALALTSLEESIMWVVKELTS